MIHFVNLISVGLLFAQAIAVNVQNFEHTSHIHQLGEDHEIKYNLPPLTLREKVILANNHEYIRNHNSNPDKTYFMKPNKFAHLTLEEFQEKMLMANQDCSATEGRSSDLPFEHYGKAMREKQSSTVFKDWRLEGNFVTPVKNQGHCGSCWTFSSTGCLESAWAVHRGELFSLSEQQLIDCAGAFDNHGCSGGLPSHAFEYVHSNGGIDTESAYHYEAKEEGKCSYNPDGAAAIRVRGSFNITEGDEDALFQAVTYFNPVSIAYQVVKDFRFYAGGVYSSDDCKQGPMDVNHAVLVVGYGTDANGVDYWIIKNSWGGDWGMEGYFWMKRGVNQCGIATCASFPVVEKN